jgi:hypothetical protein
MKRHIVTNWENDMIDAPEEKVSEFVNNYYKGFELNLLSGLRYRAIEEIYQTLKDSFVIIMQPSLFDKQQVMDIVSNLSHSIWVNFNSNTNNLTTRYFIFLSSHPFEDLKEIVSICQGLKDTKNEPALVKIVKCISCHFYGFAGEHYELRTDGYHSDNMYAVRHK